MAGYSGRSVVQKLGIKPGFRIFVDGAPASYDEIVDMVHLFAMQATSLRNKLPACRDAIAPDGMVWVSWPKKSSGVATDVTENVVRDTALSLGLVDIKVCAIDETWSGLKLVIPLKQRKRAVPAKRK